MEKVLFLLMAFMSLAVTADCQNRVTVHADGRIEYEGEAGNRITKLGKSEVIDHSALDVVYQHIIKAPTYSEPRSIYEIMEVGKNIIKYDGYSNYRLDSVISTMDSTKITNNDFGRLYARWRGPNAVKEYMFTNLAERNITFHGRVFIDNYIYNEEIPEIEWVMAEGVDTVCGYVCHEAVCDFRGRRWTAWYADDIALSDGPWKFNGLPGLILKIEDATGDHKFLAITVRRSDRPIYRDVKDPFTIERKEYNRSLAEYMNNPAGSISGSDLAPRNADGSEKTLPKRKLFFNPMELD